MPRRPELLSVLVLVRARRLSETPLLALFVDVMEGERVTDDDAGES